MALIKQTRSRGFAALLLAWLSTAHVAAQENALTWPQFRGPGGAGRSTARGLPVRWSADENVIWKTRLAGRGTSSPIVVGNKICLTCYQGSPEGGEAPLKLLLVCLDRRAGKMIWTRELPAKLPEQENIREDHGYASSTPCTDGERIYAFFGKSGVFAFDLQGNQMWHADVGSGTSGWGSAASPIVHGELLIVNASVESESLIALDRRTGREVWRMRGMREAWNTPIIVDLPGQRQELVAARAGELLAVDPSTGAPLWSCATDIQWYMVPSVVCEDGIVCALGGRSGTAALAVRCGGRGDVTQSHRLWTSVKGSNVSSPVMYNGHLYWMNDNSGIAYCAEAATGKIIYEKRVPRASQVYASALLADGRIYYVSRSGRTFVLPAEPRYELLQVNDLDDGSMFNASPAVAGNQLLLRSDRYLYCIGER